MKTIFRILVVIIAFFLLEYYNIINTNIFNQEKIISLTKHGSKEVKKEINNQIDVKKDSLNIKIN